MGFSVKVNWMKQQSALRTVCPAHEGFLLHPWGGGAHGWGVVGEPHQHLRPFAHGQHDNPRDHFLVANKGRNPHSLNFKGGRSGHLDGIGFFMTPRPPHDQGWGHPLDIAHLASVLSGHAHHHLQMILFDVGAANHHHLAARPMAAIFSHGRSPVFNGSFGYGDPIRPRFVCQFFYI